MCTYRGLFVASPRVLTCRVLPGIAILGCTVLMALVPYSARAAERVIWQIGKPDGDYAEFAIAGNHAAFAREFASAPVVFTVGESRPETHWPFIHPGPADTWAGSREHPFRIRFRLDGPPKGTFYLRIGLCDTQGRVPPQYQVSIAGQSARFDLPRGGGDQSLGDARAGRPHRIELPLPASVFRQGENEIVLTCQNGSWVLYDWIELTNNPQAVQPPSGVVKLRVDSTPFFVRRNGKLYRVLDLRVTFTSPPKTLLLTVRAGDHQEKFTLKELPLLGEIRRELLVPDLPAGTKVTVVATAETGSHQVSVRLPEQRKWRIFVAPSAHTDIGYTHIQPECAERHNQNLDLAVELAEKHPDFKWNAEVTWQVENYLATRDPRQVERFLKLVRREQIGVQALYCNILTGLCSHEEICRLLLPAYNLHRRYAIPYRSAMINDVPTLVAAMPMILAGSGIEYFSEGSNNTRAPTFTTMYDRSPLWWEGPDGSRVLMVHVPSYLYAQRLGLTESVAVAKQRIAEHIRRYEERKDYPTDAIFANGAVSDNCLLPPKMIDIVHQWNQQYEYPKVILCHNAEFFDYVKQQAAERLPQARGSAGTYWEDGAASSARETSLCRNAHEWTENAEGTNSAYVATWSGGRRTYWLPGRRRR